MCIPSLSIPQKKESFSFTTVGEKKKVSSWARIGHTWVSVFLEPITVAKGIRHHDWPDLDHMLISALGSHLPLSPSQNYTDSRVRSDCPQATRGLLSQKGRTHTGPAQTTETCYTEQKTGKKSQRSTQKKRKASHYTTLTRDLHRSSGFSFQTQGNSVTLRTCSKLAAWLWFKQECEKEKKSKGIFAETVGLSQSSDPHQGSHQIPTKLRTNFCLLEYLRSSIHPLPIHSSTYPSIHPSLLPPADPISSKVRLPSPGTWFKSRSQQFPAGWLWSSSPIHAPVCSFVKRGY